MGAARREVKIVAAIAVLAVTVAVTAAVFLSMNLSGRVNDERATAKGLRGELVAVTEKAEQSEDLAEQTDRENTKLKTGFRQCQSSVELLVEAVNALDTADASSSYEELQAIDDKGTRATNAMNICLDQKINLISTL